MIWVIYYIGFIVLAFLMGMDGMLDFYSIVLSALLASPIGFLYHGYWSKGKSLKCKVGLHDYSGEPSLVAEDKIRRRRVIGENMECGDCGKVKEWMSVYIERMNHPVLGDVEGVSHMYHHPEDFIKDDK